MTIKSNHIFHMVDQSPWPAVAAINLLSMMVGFTQWFHSSDPEILTAALTSIILLMYQWWRDASREGSLQGLHTSMVLTGLKTGMIMFITSEVMFFFSFFWAFFHSSLTPAVELGLEWPPVNTMPFNPIQVPLLNTVILLSSGVSITWAHHAMMAKNFSEVTQGLTITILLGMYFTSLQALEYWEASFSISDSVYGASFFVATGFHGLHVIVGTTFLAVCLIRHTSAYLSANHHFGFEAAAWYWHFVDIVWLFLYISIYWWGR